MKTLQEIKKEKQDRVNQLITDCDVFFAFSNEQFAEGVIKHPLKGGEKYISIGAGGYMPKGKLEAFASGMKDIEKWYKAAIKKNKGVRQQNIAYELANHESWYTGDISSAMAALGPGYTRKEVMKVYHEKHAEWVECNS